MSNTEHELREYEDFIHNKHGYCYFEMDPGKHPIIYGLYVHPQYRRQGYATEILQYVINEIKRTGYVGDIDIEASPLGNSIDREKLASFHSALGLHVLNYVDKDHTKEDVDK